MGSVSQTNYCTNRIRQDLTHPPNQALQPETNANFPFFDPKRSWIRLQSCPKSTPSSAACPKP